MDLTQTVVAIWIKVLENPHVSLTDNFFDLGGTSLLAVSLIGEIERTLRVEIPFVLLFECETLEAFIGEIGRLTDPTLEIAYPSA